MSIQLETDERGDAVVRIVTAWTTALFSDSCVLLGLESRETLPRTATSTAVQFALTAPQALDLAGKLAEMAAILLECPPPRGAMVH